MEIPTDTDIPLGCTEPDPMDGVDTAWEIVADGTETEGDLICPKSDDDFWHVAVTGERQLMQISANYRSVGQKELMLDWLGPRRLCMDASPTACTQTSECPGQTCDTLRGGCRDSQAPLCFNSSHCAGLACTQGEADTIAGSIPETFTSANLHIVHTVVPAFIPGDYYLRIYDHFRDATPDDEHKYTLTLTQLTDPDVNEPNNTVSMATPMAGGTTASCPAGFECRRGTFSYRGDVDVYQVTPSFSGTAVMYIDLVYNTGTDAVPTWQVEQGGTPYLPPFTGAVPGTGGFDRSLNAAKVMVSAEPITITVSNPSGTADLDAEYELRVRVFEDSDESPRDDEVANAQGISASGGTATQRIIADNDRDWYHVTGVPGTNGVLDIGLVANVGTPVDAPFLLKFQVYYATGNACPCPTTLDWGVNNECLEDIGGANGDCADWYQRPQIFIPEDVSPDYDWKLGGETPNELSARVPTYGDRDMYILVSHISNTPLAYTGYDETETYTLSLDQLSFVEVNPDNLTDANDDGSTYAEADNNFIPEPLAGQWLSEWEWVGVDYSSFYQSDIAIPYNGSDWVESGGGTVTEDYAVLNTVSVDVTDGPASNGCVALDFTLFDGADATPLADATTASVVLAVNGGIGQLHLASNCADAGTTGGTFTLSSDETSAVYFQTGTTGAGSITTNIPATGSTTIPFAVEVTDVAGAAPALSRLTLTGPSTGELGARSAAFTATIPPPVPPADVVVSIDLSGVAGDGIGCVATGEDGDTCLQPTSCDLAGTLAACDVTITEGNTERTFYVVAGAGSARLIVVQVSATGYLGTTLVYATRDPVLWTYVGRDVAGTEIAGVLSYPGDNDFFSVALPDVNIGNGTMWATLTYSSTPVRVNIARQDARGQMPSRGGGISINTEDDPCTSSPCDAGLMERCFYVTSNGGYFNVWVNDELHDEPPPGAQNNGVTYSVTFTFQEGCASFCHEYACRQQ